MNHYTYKITYNTGKYYIGVRSCNCNPEEDTKYLGSSKHTPNDKVILKEILDVFATRKEAVLNEIELHNKFEVSTNEMFYNKAKQTSVGFDTTGNILTEEHLDKVSKALKGRIFSDIHKSRISEKLTGRIKTEQERLNISKGRTGLKFGPRSEETKLKISIANKGTEPWIKGKDFDNNYILDKYSSRVKHKEKYYWINVETNEEKYATCQEMGLLIGKKKSKNFINLKENKRKSPYQSWILKS